MITVKVTQDHIDRGLHADCRKCPVALALSDIRPGKWHITLRELQAPHGMFVKAPAVVTAFVHDFDYRRPVSPFEFQVPLHLFGPEYAE